MSLSVNDDLPEPKQTGRLNNFLTIGLFAALLLAPVLGQALGVGIASGENRQLAAFPTISTFKQIKDLTRMADGFVNDRFGFRSQLVRLNSLWRYRLGISSTRDVVIGNDGWLFYTADRLMEQHTGADIFSPAGLEHWVSSMERVRDWLERQGIAFYIVIAPDKNTIFPDKLTSYPRRPGGTTRLDQLAQRLQRSSLDVIDPRDAMLAAKAAGQTIYFEGDSHWTERGAFIAYSLLMKRVRKRFPHIEPLTLDSFVVSKGRPMASDLVRLLALDGDVQYEVERWTLRKRRQIGQAKISARPDWGWRVAEIENNLRGKPRLLAFGDSFTDYVLGPLFLYETFYNPVYTHHNGGSFNLNLVGEVRPDVVVVEFADRYLRLVPSNPMTSVEAATR